MSNVKLEPGWLERDVVQAVRRTHELDEKRNHTRDAREVPQYDSDGSKPDLLKRD
jgi:hypothetical protein